MAVTIQAGMREKIQAAQSEALKQDNVIMENLDGLDQQMEKKEGESLYFIDRIWVPLVGSVRTMIMDEAHKSKYSVHPGADKIEDYILRKLAKIYIDEIVARHGVPIGLFQKEIGAILRHACRQTLQKSFRDEVGYEYGLSSPNGLAKEVTPRYVRPFEILERIGAVAYRIRLPKELSGVHDTFHMSNLKKCLADASLHVPLDEIKVDKTLRFVEEPVEIMDRESLIS
ncbi:hypothetical protein Tco_1556777 [Tanacetum coccineum]